MFSQFLGPFQKFENSGLIFAGRPGFFIIGFSGALRGDPYTGGEAHEFRPSPKKLKDKPKSKKGRGYRLARDPPKIRVTSRKKHTHKHTKLHPCKKTLSSRNLGFAKDSFKVSFGFRTLWRPRLIKDPKNVKKHWFYLVFALNKLNKQWLYCVFVEEL